jgi:hypothetical protein
VLAFWSTNRKGEWRNGRRARFRSVCPKGCEGSNPSSPTRGNRRKSPLQSHETVPGAGKLWGFFVVEGPQFLVRDIEGVGSACERGRPPRSFLYAFVDFLGGRSVDGRRCTHQAGHRRRTRLGHPVGLGSPVRAAGHLDRLPNLPHPPPPARAATPSDQPAHRPATDPQRRRHHLAPAAIPDSPDRFTSKYGRLEQRAASRLDDSDAARRHPQADLQGLVASRPHQRPNRGRRHVCPDREQTGPAGIATRTVTWPTLTAQ